MIGWSRSDAALLPRRWPSGVDPGTIHRAAQESLPNVAHQSTAHLLPRNHENTTRSSHGMETLALARSYSSYTQKRELLFQFEFLYRLLLRIWVERIWAEYLGNKHVSLKTIVEASMDFIDIESRGSVHNFASTKCHSCNFAPHWDVSHECWTHA